MPKTEEMTNFTCELPAVKTAGFGGFSTSFELPSTVSYTQMAVMRRKSGA
jgi:hypothetical protein